MLTKTKTTANTLSRYILLSTLCVLCLVCLSCHNLFVKLIPPDGNVITSFNLTGQRSSEIRTDGSIRVVLEPTGEISQIPQVEASKGAAVIPITWDYLQETFPTLDPKTLVSKWLTSNNQTEWVFEILKDNPQFALPELNKKINFNMPVICAVISAQGSTRLYTIIVEGGKQPEATPSDQNKIQSFSIAEQIGESRISHSPSGTVQFSVPQSVSVRALLPTITASGHATILPITNEYIRACFPDANVYDVILGYYLASDKAEYIRDFMKKGGYELKKTLDIPIDFSSPVTVAVIAWDNTVALYEVTARVETSAAQLVSFGFFKTDNAYILNDSVASIKNSDKTLALDVVFPAEHDTEGGSYNLIPHFTLVGDTVADENAQLYLVNAGGDKTPLSSGVTAINCGTSPLVLEAQRTLSGMVHTQRYTLTVGKTENPDTVRTITDFRLIKTARQNTGLLSSVIVSAIHNTNETGSIRLSVLYTDTKPSNIIIPTFITGGGATLYDTQGVRMTSGTTALSLDAEGKMDVTCRSKDEKFRRRYTISVTFTAIDSATLPRITSFSFGKDLNSSLAQDCVAQIDGSVRVVASEIRYAQDKKQRLIPTFEASGPVQVDGVPQVSGMSVQDFGTVVTYTVFDALNPTISVTYSVQAVFTADADSECIINSFAFIDAYPSGTPVVATVMQETGAISTTFSAGVGSGTRPLCVAFDARGEVRVNGEVQASGISTQSFAAPLVYTVSSPNGKYTKTYTVTVQEAGSTIYVNKNAWGNNTGSTWYNAYYSLEDALADAAKRPSSKVVDIYVAGDEYTPTAGTSFEITSGVRLYGGFAGTETSPSERRADARSTLQGNGNRVIRGQNLVTSATIDSFVITGGTATEGGGVYATGPITIENCTISNNSATEHGGGLYTEFYNKPIGGSITGNSAENDSVTSKCDDIYYKTLTAPSGVEALFDSSTGSTTVTWNRINDRDVVGYRVYCSSDTQVLYETSSDGACTWTDTRAGVSLFYRVAAVYEKYGVRGESSREADFDRGPAGGYVFYDKGSYSDGWRYLEAAPADLGRYKWGAYEKDVVGTQIGIGSGKKNTALIVAYLNNIGETGKAAQAADAYSYNGYSDWFLPSKDELNLMYQNLRAKGIGYFDNYWLWSSSQASTKHAWSQGFYTGFQGNLGKNSTSSVRVVRAF